MKEEIAVLVRYRLEQADAALGDAQFLLEGGRSTQSVINRAYYAMFYAVLALLQKTGTIPSKHAGVIGFFDTEFVLKGAFPRELSQDLHKAFELRQNADYRALQRSSGEEARETLARAVRFVQSLKDYLAR